MQSPRAAELRVLNYRMLQKPGELQQRYIEGEGRGRTDTNRVSKKLTEMNETSESRFFVSWNEKIAAYTGRKIKQ